MYGQRRVTGWAGWLLLFAVLLFGIITMHTLGQPSEHGSAPYAPQGTAVATTAHQSAGAEVSMAPRALLVPYADAPAQGHGMDPMSVCLAVLSVWSVVLLAAGLLSRRSVAPSAAARARILLALRPNPPSYGTLLAQLSVLRQ